MSTNLNEIAKEITLSEGLKQNQNIGDVKEILGVLGQRWRDIGIKEAEEEFFAIYERAGLSSEHSEVEL